MVSLNCMLIIGVHIYGYKKDRSNKKYLIEADFLPDNIKPSKHLNGLSPNLRCYNQCKFPNINYISVELFANFLLVNLLLNQTYLEPPYMSKEAFQVF